MRKEATLAAVLVTVLATACILWIPELAMAAEQKTAKTKAKAKAASTIEELKPALTDLSDQIWRFAETALRETRSAEVLARFAEEEGFTVERGVAGMPTAFVASYGQGRPILGVLGEYDALPGLSQKAQTEREALEDGGAGHGCGHNLFGAGSLGAAIAVKRLIESGALEGTIRFYGTPAEESVGGKLYMIREGLFDDLDIAIAWHPSNEIRADTEGSQALVDFVVEFHGKAAHAAYDPWNGRSAVDALEIFTFALNQMREHVRPTVRMHYAIVDGGAVPNVVPETAKLWCWLRDSKHERVDALLERARDIARGAALAAGVEGELRVQSGMYEMLVNRTGARLIQANLEALGPIPFTPEEHEFARTLQSTFDVEAKGLNAKAEPLDETPGEPSGGSTDVADVSWNVPTLHLSVTTAPGGTPWHAWPVVASGGTSIGHKGMVHAAKAMAMTLIDLYADPSKRDAIRQEFEKQTEDKSYGGYIPDGPPPIPED